MEDGMYVIKTWKVMEKEAGLNTYSNMSINTAASFLRRMEDTLPIHRHIDVKDDMWEEWAISEDMILSPAFRPGEIIEIRDGEDHAWGFGTFAGYDFTDKWPIMVNGMHFKYGRKIPKPSIEITIIINGKESQLSDISEETLLKIRKGK